MKTIYHTGERLTSEVILSGAEEHFVAVSGLVRFLEKSGSDLANDNLERLISELNVSQGRESRGLPALNFVGDDAVLIGRAIEAVAGVAAETDPLSGYKDAAKYILDNETVLGFQIEDVPLPQTVAV